MRMITKGTLNVSVELSIIDATAGTPELGVAFDEAGIDLRYRREGAVSVAITEVTLAALTDAHADGGFLEIGFGQYRLDVPDAAFATGATSVLIYGTVTGMVVLPYRVQLIDFQIDDASPEVTLANETHTGAVVPTVTANTDMRGTDSGALASVCTETRLAALTDWLDGGRLDLLLDAIPTTAMRGTDGVDTATMRGTDSAALASVCTETRLAALTDWLDGGRLDLLLDAIPTTVMRGTDSAALASVCTETRLQALTDWLNGGRLDLLLDAIPTTAMRGTDSAALASVLGAAVGADISADIAANLAKWTTVMTESYAADTVAMTPEQALFMIWSFIHDFDITGTTKTSKQLDNTTAMTHTLDDATTPTDITRAT